MDDFFYGDTSIGGVVAGGITDTEFREVNFGFKCDGLKIATENANMEFSFDGTATAVVKPADGFLEIPVQRGKMYVKRVSGDATAVARIIAWSNDNR